MKKSLVLFLFITLFLNPSYAFSQSKGLTVSPSIVKIDLDSEKPETLLYYTNTTNDFLELTFNAQDFHELEEGNKIKFLDKNSSDSYKYSLSSWISFDKKSLSLKPNEQSAIKILINKDRLSPGAHYATIQAEISQKEEKGQVKLKGILSSLVFVRSSTGKEVEQANLLDFNLINDFFTFPESISFRFQNTGNVDLTPYGKTTIKDSRGKTIAQGILNEGSQIVLPETNRKFYIPITQLSKFIFPGIYTASTNFNYGKSSKKIVKEASFFSLGTTPVYVYPVVFGIILFAILRLRRLR